MTISTTRAVERCERLAALGPAPGWWRELARDTLWVEMEIRAAEIARLAKRTRRGPWLNPRSRSVSWDELEGWSRAEGGIEPIHNAEHQHMVPAPIGWVKARLAGWMAFQIATTSADA